MIAPNPDRRMLYLATIGGGAAAVVLVWRAFGPVCFALAAACFFLPFGAVRGDEVIQGRVVSRAAETWHGVDLVVGGNTRPHLEEVTGDPRRDPLRDVTDEPTIRLLFPAVPLPPQPTTIAAAVLILAGFGVEMTTERRAWMVVSAALALGAAGALAFTHLVVATELRHRYQIHGDTSIPPAYGFWLAVGVLLGLAAGNVLVARFAPGRVPGQVDLRGPEHEGVPGLGPD